MNYIIGPNTKMMLTNAWDAISTTDNWDFVANMKEGFEESDDPRVDEIYQKMREFGYKEHSKISFLYTMTLMRLLVKEGEESLKKLF